jgi:hypothetical protein
MIPKHHDVRILPAEAFHLVQQRFNQICHREPDADHLVIVVISPVMTRQLARWFDNVAGGAGSVKAI